MENQESNSVIQDNNESKLSKHKPFYRSVWFTLLVSLIIVIGLVTLWATIGYEQWGRYQCEKDDYRHYNKYQDECLGVYTDADQPCIQNSECTGERCEAVHYTFYSRNTKEEAVQHATYDKSGYLIGKCDNYYSLDSYDAYYNNISNDYCGIIDPITKEQVDSGDFEIQGCFLGSTL